MVDTSLRDMILTAMEQRADWEKTKDRLIKRGHNDVEINDVLDDLFKRGLIKVHEHPDIIDEEITWYEPKQLTPQGYQFIKDNRLDLSKLIPLLTALLGKSG